MRVSAPIGESLAFKKCPAAGGRQRGGFFTGVAGGSASRSWKEPGHRATVPSRHEKYAADPGIGSISRAFAAHPPERAGRFKLRSERRRPFSVPDIACRDVLCRYRPDGVSPNGRAPIAWSSSSSSGYGRLPGLWRSTRGRLPITFSCRSRPRRPTRLCRQISRLCRHRSRYGNRLGPIPRRPRPRLQCSSCFALSI